MGGLSELKRPQWANVETTVVSPMTALVPRANSDAVRGNVAALETLGKWTGRGSGKLTLVRTR